MMLLIALFTALPAVAQVRALSFEASILKVQSPTPLEAGQRYMISAGNRRVAIGQVTKVNADGTAEMSLEKGKIGNVSGLSFRALATKKPWIASWGLSLALGQLKLPVELSAQSKVDLAGTTQDLRVFAHHYWDSKFLFRFSGVYTRWDSSGSARNVCRGQACVYRAQMLGGGAQLLREMRFSSWTARCGLGFDLLYAMQLETNVFEESGARFQQPMMGLCEAQWKSFMAGFQMLVIPSQAAAGLQPAFSLGYLF